MTELSLSVKSAAETAAMGPDVNAMMAACGRYATANIKVVTPIEVVRTDPSFEYSGLHRSLCDMK